MPVRSLESPARRHRYVDQRTRDPLDPARPRRLGPVLAAPRRQRQSQPVPVRLGWARLRGRPVRALVIIAGHRLAEAQYGPELRLAIPGRPTRPAYPANMAGSTLGLASRELHRRRRQLARMPGNLASCSKNFSASASPSRVAPDLSAISPEIHLIQLPLTPHGGVLLPRSPAPGNEGHATPPARQAPSVASRRVTRTRAEGAPARV